MEAVSNGAFQVPSCLRELPFVWDLGLAICVCVHNGKLKNYSVSAGEKKEKKSINTFFAIKKVTRTKIQAWQRPKEEEISFNDRFHWHIYFPIFRLIRDLRSLFSEEKNHTLSSLIVHKISTSKIIVCKDDWDGGGDSGERRHALFKLGRKKETKKGTYDDWISFEFLGGEQSLLACVRSIELKTILIIGFPVLKKRVTEEREKWARSAARLFLLPGEKYFEKAKIGIASFYKLLFAFFTSLGGRSHFSQQLNIRSFFSFLPFQ